VAQPLHERLVRDQGLLVAASEQHHCAVLIGAPAELGREPRLADPWLADEDHHPALPRTGLIQAATQLGKLRIAPHQRHRLLEAERRRQRGPSLCRRLPEDLAGRQRLGNPLQLRWTARPEAEVPARTDQRPQQLGSEDVAAVGLIAQPFGDHHRCSEIVALVTDRLTDIQAHSNSDAVDALAIVVTEDGLLDSDRAAHRVDRAGEGDHESVAEVLHLLSAVRARDVTQQAEMHAPQPLGFLIPHRLQELG